MREIKFRGYNKQKGWLYGVLERNLLTNEYSIRNFDDAVSYSVEEDSISQYTCYIDKNGKEIYEGDIVKYETYDEMDTYINRAKVYFNTELGAWMAHEEREEEVNSDIRLYSMNGKVEVIGNIYEEKKEQKVG